jgi:predicted AAA+ superfamily ATPase
MVRHLLGNPAASFSVKKFFDAAKSQGLHVSKDTLHDYLAHLEDAFLIRTISLHTASERQRMANPRKSYPVDPGLIPVYERTGRPNLGHALESAVFLELERRGAEMGYVRTEEGNEVDFLARDADGSQSLIQVCTEISDEKTYNREVRSLIEASKEYPKAEPILVTLEPLPPERDIPKGIRWQSASEWLLGE